MERSRVAKRPIRTLVRAPDSCTRTQTRKRMGSHTVCLATGSLYGTLKLQVLSLTPNPRAPNPHKRSTHCQRAELATPQLVLNKQSTLPPGGAGIQLAHVKPLSGCALPCVWHVCVARSNTPNNTTQRHTTWQRNSTEFSVFLWGAGAARTACLLPVSVGGVQSTVKAKEMRAVSLCCSACCRAQPVCCAGRTCVPQQCNQCVRATADARARGHSQYASAVRATRSNKCWLTTRVRVAF
jgi:hypothetical protein